jgi:rare lipoprotein A
MGRWLVILTLAMAQCPDTVAAEPWPTDIPLPRPRPRGPAPVARAVPTPGQNTPAQVTLRQVPPAQVPPAAKSAVGLVALHGGEVTGDVPDRLPDEPAPPVQKPRAATDCSGGKRIVSTYYWEGKHTASGQPFNPQGLTAAHRTLPFGTRLTVSNPRNGKSVTVVINDRGPFVSGIGLDLSLGAAKAIGMSGTATVCIELREATNDENNGRPEPLPAAAAARGMTDSRPPGPGLRLP